MCKSEYKLTRKMQWDGDVLKVQDTMHDVLREAKQAAEDAMTGAVLSHFECDLSDFREYMHDKIKWEQKQWAAMPRWIPVTERLPEDGTYLITWKNPNAQGVCMAYYGYYQDGLHRSSKPDFYIYDNEWGAVAFDDVTHWMPLPEPPKEEKELC